MTVKRRGASVCVLHGHPKKKGSKRDKPKGSVIKCYSIAKYGLQGAWRKARAQHYAIMKNR